MLTLGTRWTCWISAQRVSLRPFRKHQLGPYPHAREAMGTHPHTLYADVMGVIYHHSFPRGPVLPLPLLQPNFSWKITHPSELPLFLTALYLFWRLIHLTVISWQNRAILTSKRLSHGFCFLRSLPWDVRIWPWPHLTPINEPVPVLGELQLWLGKQSRHLQAVGKLNKAVNN